MRYFTTPSVREARQSVAWSLFFIFLLYFTAPAYAAFGKLEIYQTVIGQPIASLPEWIKNWQIISPYGTPWINIVDVNRDGIVQWGEFRIHPDVVVLATPEIAGLPYVIAGLVAAGGLAAALSTADGLLLALANALSHDVYYKMIDRNAPTKRRLIISRVLLIIVAILAAVHRGQHGRRHPLPRRLGLLHRRRGPLRRAGDGRVVQEDDERRGLLGHGGRLRLHLRLPDLDGVLRPFLHRALRHEGGDPGRGAPDRRPAAGLGRAQGLRPGPW
jgi:hypothetical protein